VMNQINPPVGARQADVIVNAHQWWWEFRYPKSGAVTANELFLPDGVNSLIEFKSADVVHSFWVPAFGQKMDAIPGQTTHLYFQPIREGVFTGACSEYCGADHSLMRIVANVVSAKEFATWTEQQVKVPGAPTEPIAQRGAEVFAANTCMQCHTIAGTKAAGQVGPDLTHLSSRQTIGAALMANNVDNVTAWIMDPQKLKPGCHMPNTRLNREDAHAIAVYLESLK
jgi:cytochrome c oxidase subunit 2